MGSIVAAIPARLRSTRFSEKILAELGGVPVLKRVLQRVQQAAVFDDIVALVDNTKVKQLIQSWGFQAILTDENCNSGTERITSVLDQLKGDFIVNVQGDEPFISLDLLKNIADKLHEDTSIEMLTAIYKIQDPEYLKNPNRVKVVINKNHQALYFSRNCIPFQRDASPSEDWTKRCDYWGHLGIYAYARDLLARYSELSESTLEQFERLEQLRFLENGIAIHCIFADEPSIGIDVPEDLHRAEQFLKAHPEFK